MDVFNSMWFRQIHKADREINPSNFDIAGRRNVHHANRCWNARECSREVGAMSEINDNRNNLLSVFSELYYLFNCFYDLLMY